jgi:hypothetical protein
MTDPQPPDPTPLPTHPGNPTGEPGIVLDPESQTSDAPGLP